MLPQHFQQSFLDLGCIDADALLLHLLHFLLVEFHQLDIWISLDWLLVFVNDLIVAIDTVNVFKEAFKNGRGRWDVRVDQDSATKVDSSLHQVVGAEVILRELSDIVSTE